MNSITNLIRPDLREFDAYSSARDEANQGKIWLNANESPYPFEVQDGLIVNRYPEKQPRKLIEQLATIYNVGRDQMVLSRGSDEVIDLLTRLFCTAGKDAIITCPPTFGMYSISGKLQAARVIEIPLLQKDNYQLDVESILSYRDTEVKIIFLCSPNNPTGNIFKREDILNLCKQYTNKSIVVVDEAYIEFSEASSLANDINQYENLVILRTFSKAYGLAGARCGLLLAQKEIIRWIKKIIAPYPLSSLSIQLIYQTVTTDRFRQIQQQIFCIKSERKRLFNELKLIPCIKKVWPSEANFILVDVSDVKKVMLETAKQGIILRDMSNKMFLEQAVRMTIGLPDENNKLIDSLCNV